MFLPADRYLLNSHYETCLPASQQPFRYAAKLVVAMEVKEVVARPLEEEARRLYLHPIEAFGQEKGLKSYYRLRKNDWRDSSCR